MRFTPPQSSFALGFILFAITNAPAYAGDVSRGELLVHQWCSNCHATDASMDATDAAPSFNSIARKNKENPDWVSSWLANPHPPMPNFDLSHQDIQDIQSYLRSLVGGAEEKTPQGDHIITEY